MKVKYKALKIRRVGQGSTNTQKYFTEGVGSLTVQAVISTSCDDFS